MNIDLLIMLTIVEQDKQQTNEKAQNKGPATVNKRPAIIIRQSPIFFIFY